MEALSAKQKRIYDYIISFTAEHGYPPSVREVAGYVGVKSPSTVHFHMKTLRKKGYITQAAGKTRAITINAGPAAADRDKAAVQMPDKEDRDRPVNQVPVVGNVAAGAPILAEEYIEEYLPFDTGGLEDEHFALKVRGESMRNAGILPGDLVVVHRQQEFRNGDIVVALFEDEATVKTLRRKDGHTWLMPENPEYEPINGDFATLLGKVVAVVRRY